MLKDLENDVLNLTDKLIPPQTSFTQDGGDGGGGRPTKELVKRKRIRPLRKRKVYRKVKNARRL